MTKINNKIVLGMLLSSVFALSYCTQNLPDQNIHVQLERYVENTIRAVNEGREFLSQLTSQVDIQDKDMLRYILTAFKYVKYYSEVPERVEVIVQNLLCRLRSLQPEVQKEYSFAFALANEASDYEHFNSAIERINKYQAPSDLESVQDMFDSINWVAIWISENTLENQHKPNFKTELLAQYYQKLIAILNFFKISNCPAEYAMTEGYL